MNLVYRSNTGQVLLDREIGAGGEAKTYTVRGNPRVVAKIYYQPSADQAAKLYTMVSNPPDDPGIAQGHISIAWPTGLLLDNRNHCVGFLMPYIDYQQSVPLLKLYNPRDR